MMLPLLLGFLSVFIVGCGAFDLTHADTYDIPFSFEIFAEPREIQHFESEKGVQYPNLPPDYWSPKKLYQAGNMVRYDLYLGDHANHHFYANSAQCGYSIFRFTMPENSTEQIAECISFTFDESSLRWNAAQSDTIIGDDTILFVHKPDLVKTAFTKLPEETPKFTVGILNMSTGEFASVQITAPTSKREFGTSFWDLCISPDFQYFATYFASNFRQCHAVFNQGYKCDFDFNLVTGRLQEGSVHLIHKANQFYFDTPNKCKITWTPRNDLVFEVGGKTFLSENRNTQ